MSRLTMTGVLLGYRCALPKQGVLTRLSEFVSRRLQKCLPVSSRADRYWVTSSSYPVRAGDKEAGA